MRTRAQRLLLVITAFALGACGDADIATQRAERAAGGTGELLIAAPWPWAARSSAAYAQGLEFAVEEWNARGGVNGRPLRIVRPDDNESINAARLIAQQLADDPNVVAVIGHLQSDVTIPAAAIYDVGGLLLIAPTATDPALTARGYQRVFRMIFTDRDVGRHMAEHAAEQGYRRPAVYYIRNGYGHSLASAFEERAVELGLTIANRLSYDPAGQTNARVIEAAVTELAVADMDALFIAGEAAQAALLVRELRRRKLDVPVLGGDALSTPQLLEQGGEAVEGVVVASAFLPDDARPEVLAFAERYRARYGRLPGTDAALAYDAVNLLVHGMTTAGSAAPANVAAALRSGSGWHGVTGELAFDAHGNLTGRRVHMAVVDGGSFRHLGSAAARVTAAHE